jgi:hypothetical protein
MTPMMNLWTSSSPVVTSYISPYIEFYAYVLMVVVSLPSGW